MPPSVNARLIVYVGHGNATGDIRLFGLDPASGQLAEGDTVATGSSTSFVAFHPSQRFAYTTHNRADRVGAYAIDQASGGLTRLNEAAVPPRPSGQEVGPAYATVDAQGRFLLVANYRGHNTVVFQLEASGAIGPLVCNVSAGQHAHCVCLSPDNQSAFVPHLGSDLVAQYRFDPSTGALTPRDPPWVKTAEGAGPRHLTFAPDGRHAYLLTELDAMLYGYRYDDAAGTLSELWRVPTLPADYDGRRWAADIHVQPDGRTIYVSNRAHDSLTVFAVDPAGGPPALVQRVPCGGTSPRNFALAPGGRFVLAANQDSGNLISFAVDQGSGRLSPIADTPVGPAPYFVHALSLP